MKRQGKIYIGTSGWNYAHWIGTFYPGKLKSTGYLGYYANHFHSVEVNNSFYRWPEEHIFNSWKVTVPGNFVFSVKANRYITHMKKLIVDKRSLNELFGRSAELGRKCGPILFQLPPNWKMNIERLKTFLEALPPKRRCTFEFRHPSWHCDDVYALLTQHQCAFCIYDIGGFQSPILATTNFVYIRLHGPGNKYQGSYTDGELNSWADQCMQWAKEGKDTFIYFDNDEKAYATLNAKTLQDKINSII